MTFHAGPAEQFLKCSLKLGGEWTLNIMEFLFQLWLLRWRGKFVCFLYVAV